MTPVTPGSPESWDGGPGGGTLFETETQYQVNLDGDPAMTLHHALPGSASRIRRLSGEPGLRERLAELGLTPGQTVRLLRRAPLGDPLEVLVRGYRLAIRREEAEAIEVEIGRAHV